MHEFEEALLEEMRTHDGRVTTGPLAGHPLLILTSSGAKTGEERRAILTFSRDQGDYVVAGTAGGSPTTPAWIYNLREHPEVEIEVENRTFDATARIVGMCTLLTSTIAWFRDGSTGRSSVRLILSPRNIASMWVRRPRASASLSSRRLRNSGEASAQAIRNSGIAAQPPRAPETSET